MLFADDKAQAWLTFVSSPNNKAHWTGGRYADLYSAIETTKDNAGHYFNNSIIRAGASRRSDENSEAFVCVVIDVTEDDALFHFPPARPTAIVRTSLRNYQFIYAFRRPVGQKVYPSFVDALAAAIKSSDLATNPFDGEHEDGCELARYSRLPSGINPKDGRGGFKTELVEESGIKYSLRDLAKAFRFKSESPVDQVFVPVELRKRRSWICWKWAPNPDGGKPLKIPVSAVTGESGGWQQPASHTTYDVAVAYAAKMKLSGVGFVFTKGCGLVGMDLDDCLDSKTDVIETWAQEIIDFAETYAEISPSGSGVKLWAKGEIKKSEACKPARVEIYSSGRFFAFTGRHVPGTPDEVRAAPRAIAAVLERARTFKATVAGQRIIDDGVDDDDDDDALTLGRAAYRGTPLGKINQRAIKNPKRWVLDLLPAAREYQDGYRVSSHDLGRNTQEDLAILPKGIKDWSVHDLDDHREGKRTAIDLVIEHGSEKGEKGELDTPEALKAAFADRDEIMRAAWWLAERLGLASSNLASSTLESGVRFAHRGALGMAALSPCWERLNGDG